jgi:hypothetical protein
MVEYATRGRGLATGILTRPAHCVSTITDYCVSDRHYSRPSTGYRVERDVTTLRWKSYFVTSQSDVIFITTRVGDLPRGGVEMREDVDADRDLVN